MIGNNRQSRNYRQEMMEEGKQFNQRELRRLRRERLREDEERERLIEDERRLSGERRRIVEEEERRRDIEDKMARLQRQREEYLEDRRNRREERLLEQRRPSTTPTLEHTELYVTREELGEDTLRFPVFTVERTTDITGSERNKFSRDIDRTLDREALRRQIEYEERLKYERAEGRTKDEVGMSSVAAKGIDELERQGLELGENREKRMVQEKKEEEKIGGAEKAHWKKELRKYYGEYGPASMKTIDETTSLKVADRYKPDDTRARKSEKDYKEIPLSRPLKEKSQSDKRLTDHGGEQHILEINSLSNVSLEPKERIASTPANVRGTTPRHRGHLDTIEKEILDLSIRLSQLKQEENDRLEQETNIGYQENNPYRMNENLRYAMFNRDEDKEEKLYLGPGANKDEQLDDRSQFVKVATHAQPYWLERDKREHLKQPLTSRSSLMSGKKCSERLLEDEYKDRYSSSTYRMQNLNQDKEYRENMTSVHKGETDREERLKQPPTTRRMLRFDKKIPERSLDQGYRETFNSSGIRARSLNIEEEYGGVRTEARKDAMFIDEGIEILPFDNYVPPRVFTPDKYRERDRNRFLTNTWNVDPEHRERVFIEPTYERERLNRPSMSYLQTETPEYDYQMEQLERRRQRELSIMAREEALKKKELELNRRQSWIDNQWKMKKERESVDPYEEALGLKEKELEEKLRKLKQREIEIEKQERVFRNEEITQTDITIKEAKEQITFEKVESIQADLQDDRARSKTVPSGASTEQKETEATKQENELTKHSERLKCEEVKDSNTDEKNLEKSFYFPKFSIFSAEEPKPKGEASYEEWKYEVACARKENIYPSQVLAQAIRKSLRGQAKRQILSIGTTASIEDILHRLEGVFGNVATAESVLQEFYTATQKQEESVAAWGLRLEEILQKAIDKGHVKEEDKNSMLKNKFWKALRNDRLKNATRIAFSSASSFDELRKLVRAEEYELKLNTGMQHQTIKTKVSEEMESKEETKLDMLLERLASLEQQVKEQSYNKRPGWRQRPRQQISQQYHSDTQNDSKRTKKEEDRNKENLN